MRFLSIFPIVAVLSACAGSQQVALTPAGSGVEVVKVEPDHRYEYVGDVTGAAKGDAEVAMASARNDLRNNAAANDADLVVLDAATSGNAMDWTGRNQVVLSGRAYRRTAR